MSFGDGYVSPDTVGNCLRLVERIVERYGRSVAAVPQPPREKRWQRGYVRKPRSGRERYNNPITPKERRKIVRLARTTGMTYLQIGAVVGCSDGAVSLICRRAGFRREKGNWQAARRKVA